MSHNIKPSKGGNKVDWSSRHGAFFCWETQNLNTCQSLNTQFNNSGPQQQDNMCFNFMKTIQEQPEKHDCADYSNVLTNFPPSLNTQVCIKSKHHYLDLKGRWETLRVEKRPCTQCTAVPRPSELFHSLNQAAQMHMRPWHIRDGCHSEHFELLRKVAL